MLGICHSDQQIETVLGASYHRSLNDRHRHAAAVDRVPAAGGPDGSARGRRLPWRSENGKRSGHLLALGVSGGFCVIQARAPAGRQSGVCAVKERLVRFKGSKPGRIWRIVHQ